MNTGSILASKSGNLSFINLLTKWSGTPPTRALYTHPSHPRQSPSSRGRQSHKKPDCAAKVPNKFNNDPVGTVEIVPTAATATAAVTRRYQSARYRAVRTVLPALSVYHRPKADWISQICFKDFADEGVIAERLLVYNPYKYCTKIQAQTMGPITGGFDVLAISKTGTGKTLAFLLPAIQRHLLDSKPRHRQPSILVLSPTRELAMQIEQEAQKIIGNTVWRCQTAVGGTNINNEVQILHGRCDILVATPGRLLDHILDHDLVSKLSHLRCLVLDEVDLLLNQGSRRELERISTLIPPEASAFCQNLLFSATISSDVEEIARLYLNPQHKVISTVNDSEDLKHKDIEQEFLLLDSEWQLPMLAKLIVDSARKDPATKIICFFNTARATALAAATLGSMRLPIPIYEVHSKKTQPQRTKVIRQFTPARSGVMLSTDVIARGTEIPGITKVIQVGLPKNPEQYINRLARAGGCGSALFILAPWEQRFLAHKDMDTVPIKESTLDGEEVARILVPWKEKIDEAMLRVDDKVKCKAYRAMLGYYMFHLEAMGLSQSSLLLVVNQYAKKTLRWKLGVDGKLGLPPIVAKTIKNLPNELKDQLNLVDKSPFVK